MLSVDRMRVLHAIAVNGSLNGAAEALHVTNSAVSQQLSKLEREVGQPLVERSGRGVRLTEAAELLVEHTGRILSLVQRAEAEVEAHRGAVVGQLRLSSIATAARGLAAPALVALRESHPGLRVRLVEQEPDDSVPAVARGESDMAVVVDWVGSTIPLPKEMMRAPLMDDVADIAVPAVHPLAHRDLIDIDEVLKEPWISWSGGSICDNWLHGMLRERGVEPDIAHEAEEHQTKMAMIAAGLGVAVMPRMGRGPVPEGVRLVPVQSALTRQVYVFWRADAARRPAIRAAVRALRVAASAYGS
ncbi:molybdate transport repressor ModE-like protein [Lipingzhangella halophila]|uniref:Molybdate transport repressor ModE-like protein n=1 Tax=Lipingzhangella halophila TaxID=1783352 RepID=A0A7W7RFH6_9ACTN|nr:LysR family transcriptional regulator [Lipingzhangella halophila]MBB4930967.1 molybdate transport repressor ModE-like protein [Lipingzhangella halophila]